MLNIAFYEPKEWEQQFTLSCKVTSGRVNAIKFKPASKVFTFKVSPPKYAAPKIPSLNYPASKISSSKYPALTKMIGGWGQNSPAKMIGEMIGAKMIGGCRENAPTKMIEPQNDRPEAKNFL